MPTARVYTDADQTAILSLQRQGGRLVRMQRDGKRPAYKWGGRTGRCLTQHQVETWLRIDGRFALVPFSIGFSVSWISMTALGATSPLSTHHTPSYRHASCGGGIFIYSDSTPRPNAQKRKLYGCRVDVRSASGYVALWHPEAVLEAAEKPSARVSYSHRRCSGRRKALRGRQNHQ